jgi:hypothetical protein
VTMVAEMVEKSEKDLVVEEDVMMAAEMVV